MIGVSGKIFAPLIKKTVVADITPFPRLSALISNLISRVGAASLAPKRQ